MHSVELSDTTYRRLLRHSLSFEESPDDVIARLLDQVGDGDPLRGEEILKRVQSSRGRRRSGSILPERSYWNPILEVIAEGGGAVPANDVIAQVGERLKHDLTPLDFEQLDTGEIRWRNRARFARLRMREAGLISDASRRGVWEITDVGREFLGATK